MKSVIFVVFGLMVTSALTEKSKTLNIDDLGHDAYGYFKNIGIPEAERIYEEEENSQFLMPRIVGGEEAEIVNHSYQVALLVSLKNFTGIGLCGGALINSNKIVTAAHCWDDGVLQGKCMTVILGSNKVFSGGVRIDTCTVHMHPDWSPYMAENDIAVIDLHKDVTFTDVIAPIALPSKSDINEDFVGKLVIASGYGRIAQDIPIEINQSLKSMNTTVISNEECSIAYPKVIKSSNICTSSNDTSGIVSVCKGDSGGPLAIVRDDIHTLLGVVSFGSIKGCNSGSPSAYSRVTSYLDFISLYE